MDSDDPVGRNFRKGKRVIKIPLNGSQKIQFKNITKEVVYVRATLHSSRFCILNCRMTTDGNRFQIGLPPDKSIVIVMEDNGHVEINKKGRQRHFFEGVLIVEVKDAIQSILLDTDPETDSYKELRTYKDGYADCDIDFVEYDKIKNFLSIEPISDEEYGKILPRNVKMLRMNEDDMRHNFKMVEADTMRRIAAINPFLEPSEYKKALDIIAKEEERHWTNQKESKKSNPSSAASKSKRSVTSEKSDKKSYVASQLVRSEKSEAKSSSEIPKSTLKSEKTTKSEMVQKSEKIDMPEQKSEEKNKKKRKKRCVIC